MIKSIFNKKNFGLLIMISLFCGILVSCMQLRVGDEISLEAAFVEARDGHTQLPVNEYDRKYGANGIICFFNLLFFFPAISQFFMDNFDTAKAFVFVRLPKISKWYKYKVLGNIVYCLFSAILYNLTIVLMGVLIGFKVQSPFQLLYQVSFGIFTHFLIVFLLSMLSNIIAIKTKPYVGACTALGITVMMIVQSGLATIEEVEFCLLAYYYSSWHTFMSNSNVDYIFPAWFYYSVISALVVIEVFIGYRILKKSDQI